MRQTGTVIRDLNGELKVRVMRPRECEHCGMCDQKDILLDPPAGKWNVGDEVEIDMPADRLLKASALTYVLPLIMLILGLVLGETAGGWLGMDGNLAGLIIGLAFMIAAFMLVKILAPRLKKKGALDMDMTPCGHSIGEITSAQIGDNKRASDDCDNGGNKNV